MTTIPANLSQHAIACRLADARMLVQSLRDDMDDLCQGFSEPHEASNEENDMIARVAYLDGLIEDMNTLHHHVVNPDSDPDPVISYIMQERV